MEVSDRSSRTLILAEALVISAGVGFFLAAYFVAMAMVLPHQPSASSALIPFVLAAILLALAASIQRDTSLFWRIPLGACAVAMAVVGAVVLMSLASNDWHLLNGSIGVKAALCLVTSFGLAWLVRRLQARGMPEQDA